MLGASKEKSAHTEQLCSHLSGRWAQSLLQPRADVREELTAPQLPGFGEAEPASLSQTRTGMLSARLLRWNQNCL